MSGLWERVEEISRSVGLDLFDLEIPSGRHGALRVFISRPGDNVRNENSRSMNAEPAAPAVRGITHQDCVKVSRKILEYLESSEFTAANSSGMRWDASNWTLEVSSPGVNRKLTRPAHFRGALGERIRVATRAAGAVRLAAAEPKENISDKLMRRKVFVGTLLAFDGSQLEISEETSHACIQVPIAAVTEARVDFKF